MIIHKPPHKNDKTNTHILIISSNEYFFLKIKVRIRTPNVPITSKKEEMEIASVSINPDCKTDSNARFKAKYMKNRYIQRYIRRKVAFFTDA